MGSTDDNLPQGVAARNQRLTTPHLSHKLCRPSQPGRGSGLVGALNASGSASAVFTDR